MPYGPRVLEISKIDRPSEAIIGCLEKASRPLEPGHELVLGDIQYFTKLVKENKIPVTNIFIDTKSGMIIKTFDPDEIERAQKEEI